jgi:YggT family protein
VTVVLCPIIQLYIYILVGRAILSFFPIGPESALAPILRILLQLTEPVLAPLRRVIPPLGMFDLSFLVLILVLEVVHGRVCGGAGLF